MVAKTERFEMRLEEDTLERIDAWRIEEPDSPSRAEAVRRLMEVGLSRSPAETVRFSDGEKLTMLMLRDLYRHLKVKDAEIDPEFISDIISGGHYWAAKWKLTGVFHGHEDDQRNVHEVVNVLAMWDFIEMAYNALGKKEREKLEKDAAPLGKSVKFRGFDGNNESEHMSIARFLVNEMGRFSRFAGRDLNSHMPSIETYRRMFRVFEPMRATFIGHGLSLAQLTLVLQAQEYPKQ